MSKYQIFIAYAREKIMLWKENLDTIGDDLCIMSVWWLI